MNNSGKREMALFIGAVSLTLSAMTNVEERKSINYTPGGSQALFYPDEIAFVTISQSYNP
jgi:hypothetical protein